ncbi:class I SAM-dependent methyltransferase [Natrononativus amylolyticus]|uniref:class I SAM-dependent methyltransferase n=1 Tax=Natrononativus amylolyticus TaxID=2963434 RepID=UPI0020CCC4BA|nr:class I SAM-dependent methyltransferase [Natrononativus amylolyticus]
MTDDADRKRASADSFGAATDAYRRSDVHRRGEDLERLARWCRGADVALDVATGAGHTAGAIAAAGVPTVVATDASPEMVATAVDSFEGVRGAVADAERLPFSGGAFDAVVCRIAAHHFPNPERFVAETARVLRSGGTFALEDNVAPAEPELAAFVNRVERLRDPTHVEAHPTSRWREWLERHGFAVEAVDHLHKPLAFDDWAAAQSLAGERRRRVERLLLEAPPEATETFRIRVEDGAVRSFAPRKALIRATRRE